jgi:hypothetical protein
MAAVLDWRLTAFTPIDPGPLPWLPCILESLHADPVWGGYLAKRSQLVADLADQVQDHLCQGDGPPAWAAAGIHPSTALIGEIAVWRAANGINPQDPQPTGGTQLETTAALWKQRLDWHIARSTNSSGNETFNERQAAAHTALSRSHHDIRRPYQTPSQRPNAPAQPAVNPVELPASGTAMSTSPSACWSDFPRRSFGCQWSPTFSVRVLQGAETEWSQRATSACRSASPSPP